MASSVLITAVEKYVRNIAEETRNIQIAIASSDQVVNEVRLKLEQSLQLTESVSEAQIKGLTQIQNAVKDLAQEAEDQKQESLVKQQRPIASMIIVTLHH